jgi:hypothetical protein
MTDVSIPAAAPSAPAPTTSEVAINTNQTHIPAPVGSQAPANPDAAPPEGSKHRPESRLESIQKAFDQAAKEAADAAKNAPKAAAAKPEAKPDGKLDAKPEAKPQLREQGRFARQPDAGNQTPKPDAQPAPGSEPAQKYAPLPETAPFREAPQRMNERAKADWAGTPESVRGEIGRMQKEFEGAYKQFRGDHETMNAIRPFHQMAQQHGTTLAKALDNYVTMEQKLRTDLVGGLDMIVNNLNLKTPDGRPISMRDVAYHILNQTPDQHRMAQTTSQQQAMTMQLGQISQRLAQLDQTQKQLQSEQQYRSVRSSVDQFADDPAHHRFDELHEQIKAELELGFSLPEAYRRADRLYPANTAAQTRNSTPTAAQTRDTSAQTRNEDRSISGSPSGGDAPQRRAQRGQNGKAPGRRDAINNAIKKVSGQY